MQQAEQNLLGFFWQEDIIFCRNIGVHVDSGMYDLGRDRK